MAQKHVLGLLVLMTSPTLFATELFVAMDGDDQNPGHAHAPLRTINRAAEIAQPGDTITVREGVYREWVRPVRGGTSEKQRIVYQAEQGADVRIMGSEPADGWQRIDGQVWMIEIAAEDFGDFNPFDTLSRHPEDVEQDEAGDGWGWLKYGRWMHLGGRLHRWTRADGAADHG